MRWYYHSRKRGKMMKENTVKTKTIITVLTAIIVLLIGAGVTVGIIMYNSNSQPTQQSQGVVFDNNASHYEKTVENKGGNDSGIKVPGYPDITVNSGTKDFPITLLNPKGNPCNFKFTLTLADTGENICTTNLVKPGDAIKGVTLDKALKKGEYTLLVNIATYSTADNSEMNGAQVKTKLTVE